MLRNYLIIAYKILLRRKFFSAVSLFGVGFTLLVLLIAAAIFDHCFADNPPEVYADRTLAAYQVKAVGPDIQRYGSPGYALLDKYVRSLPKVERVTIFSSTREVVSYHAGAKIMSWLKRVDGEFFKIMRFDFVEGRPISVEDEAQAKPVAVITRATAARFFADGPALGKTIGADGQRFRVVGIVENVSRLRDFPFADIWVPISTSKSTTYRSEVIGGFRGLILARDAADFADIKSELRSRLEHADLPELYETVEMAVESHAERVTARCLGRPTISDSSTMTVQIALAGLVVLLFMLLPAVNLINLNVSRIIERAPEIGIRKAFGASSRTLVAQFLIENIVLTLIGAVLALGATAIVLEIIDRSGFVPYADFSLSLRVFAVAIVLAVFFGLLSGVYPAWRMSRLHPARSLSGRSL